MSAELTSLSKIVSRRWKVSVADKTRASKLLKFFFPLSKNQPVENSISSRAVAETCGSIKVRLKWNNSEVNFDSSVLSSSVGQRSKGPASGSRCTRWARVGSARACRRRTCCCRSGTTRTAAARWPTSTRATPTDAKTPEPVAAAAVPDLASSSSPENEGPATAKVRQAWKWFRWDLDRPNFLSLPWAKDSETLN